MKKYIFLLSLALLAITMVLVFYVLLRPKATSSDVELTTGNIILQPLEKQIFQQVDGSGTVKITLKTDALCSIDGKELEQLSDLEVGIGLHTLRCETDKELDERQFFVGDVFVVAGQSNALGASLNFELEPEATQFSVMYDPYQRQFRSPGMVLENKEKGIEIGGSAWPAFVNTYYRESGVPVGLINLTRVSPIGIYLAGKEHPKSDFFYPFFISELQKFGPMKGVIWYHGESAEATPELAASYHQDLLKFIGYVRSDIQYDVPFYLVNIGRVKNESVSQERLDTVRQAVDAVSTSSAQVSIVARAEAYSLNCEESMTSTDCVHLGQQGLNNLGNDVAKALLHE